MPYTWKEKIKKSAFWVLPRLLPTLNALLDAATVALMITDRANDDDYSDTTRFLLLCTAPTFAFLQSMALNTNSTIEGMKETYKVITTCHHPESEEWPILPKGKEIFCVVTIGVVSVAVLNADFFSGYFFVDEVPSDYQFAQKINLDGWRAFAITTGIISASTTAFTECVALLKALRQKFAGVKVEYLNNFSKYTTIILGNTLAFIAGVETSIEAYASIKKILHPTSDEAQYILFTSCFTKLFSDFTFSGQNCIDGIKEFTEKLSHGNIKPTEVEAFLLTGCTAVLVVFAQPNLTNDLINDSRTSPPFMLPPAVTFLLGIGVTMRDSIVQVHLLYPHVYKHTLKFNNKLQQTAEKIKNLFCNKKPLLPLLNEPLLEEKNESPSFSSNTHLFFSHHHSINSKATSPRSDFFDHSSRIVTSP